MKMSRSMKRELLWAIAPLTVAQIILMDVSLKPTAKAENPDHMRQLLQTGNCENCDLSGANLSGLSLRGANLSGANLSEATLQQTQLLYANLENADLSNAVLAYSDLSGANLRNADLSGIRSVFLCDADSAQFEDLDDCVNTVAVLQVGQLDFCSGEYGLPELFAVLAETGKDCEEEVIDQNLLLYARQRVAPRNLLYTLGLVGADLSGANLSGAYLAGADLRYANLSEANATGADLSYAMLIDAEIESLRNADLTLAWKSRRELGDWLSVYRAEGIRDRKEQVGRKYLSQLGERQLSFYDEFKIFTDDMDSIASSVSDESQASDYTVGFELSEDKDLVLQYALSNDNNLHSYISILTPPSDPDSRFRRMGVICESEDVGVVTRRMLPNLETIATALELLERGCLEGWSNTTYGFSKPISE